MTFRDRLEARWDRGLFLCIGLDPVWDRLPVAVTASAGSDPSREARAAALARFCCAIVDATAHVACAFKPNAAFFEAEGAAGFAALATVVRHMRAAAPDVPVLYDAKRGDIGSTNQGYADHAFDELGADAVTVHPYLGQEALGPFLARPDKGTIVLVRTSNPGGGEFQDLTVAGEPLYRVVARRVAGHWNGNGNCAVVVGATYPDELAAVRAIVGDLPILIPGIGAQGGDLRRTVEAGRDARGRGMIISASRSILYASRGDDFAAAARAEAERLTAEIQDYNSMTTSPDTAADPLDLMREAGAFYEAPRDADGRRAGPLVGYAGKDAEGRQFVGDIYVNFARAERRPALLQVFARRLLALARARGLDLDAAAGFIGAPEGGKAFAYQLGLEAGKGYIYPEKTVTAAASATAREASEMVFSRHEPEPGESWFIVEDVCNNFSTTAKLVALIEGHGATVAGILCFLNRSETVGESYAPRPGLVLPVVALVRKPFGQFAQGDATVAEDVARLNVVWSPKKDWPRLAAAMAGGSPTP